MELKKKDYIKQLKDLLVTRAQKYRTVFAGPTGEYVLKDLARFCRAHESTFHKDDRAHAVLEGRREVFLRIQHHLNLSEKDLWNLYQGNK